MLQIARWRGKDNEGNVTYPITTVDTLFAHGRSRTLVLAHLDLEGHEADALRGANRTLWRDRPVLTVETFPTSMAKWHAEVMALLKSALRNNFMFRHLAVLISTARRTKRGPREESVRYSQSSTLASNQPKTPALDCRMTRSSMSASSIP